MKSTISHKAGFLAPAILHTGFVPSSGAGHVTSADTVRTMPKATHAGKTTARNIALFLAAPFIGLAYIVALPVVGFAMIARIAVRAALATPATA